MFYWPSPLSYNNVSSFFICSHPAVLFYDFDLIFPESVIPPSVYSQILLEFPGPLIKKFPRL